MSVRKSIFYNSVGWSVALLLFIAFAVVWGLRIDREWALTHWLFSCESEVLKRALVGELWRQLNWPAGFSDLHLAAGFFLAALVTLPVVESLGWRAPKLLSDRSASMVGPN